MTDNVPGKCEQRPKGAVSVPGIGAPFSRQREHELAGHKSTTIRLSLDDPGTWPNYIFENSRFAIFIWHQNEGKMLLLARGLGMPKKFRKQACTSAEQFLDKINKYLNK